MRTELYLRLANREWFWTFRRRAYLARFAISSLVFRSKFAIGEYRKNLGLIGLFTRVSILAFLAAVVSAVALQLFDNYFLILPLRIPAVPSADRYVNFLTAVAQIGGVFIGLYYAGVTAAAGAIYSQTPSTIRNLLVRERVGNVYTLFLTFVTFLPLVLITFRESLQLNPPRFAMPVVSLLAGVGIIAFVQLGKRAFELFDPTNLSHTVFSELNYWSDSVVAGAYQWKDRSFQNHARNRAVESIAALETISEYSLAQHTLRREPLIALTTNVLKFLVLYSGKKHSIPSDSFWYERTFAHPDWFRTEDSTVQIASQTGTFVQPKEVPKQFWVEDRLERLVVTCFEANSNTETMASLLAPGKYLVSYLTSLAEEGETERAFALTDKFYQLLCAVLQDKGLSEADFAGFADFVGHLPIAILLGTSSGIQRRDPEEQEKRLAKIDWNISTSVYALDFPAGNLEQLEWLQRRISSENTTEGRRITPNWYCLTYVLLGDANNVALSVQKLLSIDEFFIKPVKQLAQKRPEGAAAVLSRSLEYLSKLEHHVKIVREMHAKISAKQNLSDLPWPQIEPESWIKQLEKQSEAIHEQIVQLVPKIASRKPDGTLPDYRGQFVQLLAEDLMKRIFNGDSERVKRIYPVYFVSCLSVFDYLRPQILPQAVHLAESQLHLASAPLIDLLDLSGYARLFSEYHQQPQLWEPIKAVWLLYIQGKNDILKLLAGIVSLENISFHIPHRGLLRTNWQIEVRRRLDKLLNRSASDELYSATERVDHPSALVRYFARSTFTDGVDIMVGDFLAKLPGGDKLTWGQKSPERFQEEIIEEEPEEGDEE